MTLYMDVHEALPAGTTAADVAGAHARDLVVQAPDAEAATAVHREAHGLVADRHFSVVQGQ